MQMKLASMSGMDGLSHSSREAMPTTMPYDTKEQLPLMELSSCRQSFNHTAAPTRALSTAKAAKRLRSSTRNCRQQLRAQLAQCDV